MSIGMYSSNHYNVKKYSGSRCKELRSLWKEVFYDDSEEFTEYYFSRKVHKNIGFSITGQSLGAGELHSAQHEEEHLAMLYLSPYQMMIRVGKHQCERELHYIIGVATREECRGRGFMRTLLKEALYEMHRQQEAFTFLMPADPAIYKPFGFHYIYNRPVYEFKENYDKEKPYSRKSCNTLNNGSYLKQLTYDELSSYEKEQFRDYVDYKLKSNFQVYIKRDEEYYSNILEELKVQNGTILVRMDSSLQPGIKGYFFYFEEGGEPQIQEAFWEEGFECDFPFEEQAERKPIIMARVVNIENMIGLMRTREGSVKITIRVSDPVISENNGVWQFDISTDSGAAYKLEASGENEDKSDLSASIDGLTAFLFGYQSIEQCFHFHNDGYQEAEELINHLEKIIPLRDICLNEIV